MRKMYYRNFINQTLRNLFALFVFSLLIACNQQREAKEQTDSLPQLFPDYCGVTIPRGIAPLNFSVPEAEHIQAEVRDMKSNTLLLATGGDHVEMDIDRWHEMISSADSLEVTVSVWNQEHPDGIRYKSFSIYVSDDEMDPWIMYRLIPPGYESWNKMGIYQRSLADFNEYTITDQSDAGIGCMNCHSACNGNPDNFSFHSRGEHGGTLILRNGRLTKVNLKSLEPGLQGSYNIWHPSARYIAYSSNKTVQSFMARSRDKIEGYDLRGDIIVYDVENNKMHWDERFTNDSTLESFPAFSPDGRWLYFVSANPVNMPTEYAKLRYNILRVPFDPETAQLGEVDTIFSAHEMQRSAIIPRISPDGRYLMYSTSPTGALNLFHVDSDLGMLDLQTGDSVDCSKLNSDECESYHNWSTNGHWVIFSSKRTDGRFARVYLAHWDGKQWGKPFLLPQEDPKHNTLRMYSYNIPEYITKAVNLDRNELRKLMKD